MISGALKEVLQRKAEAMLGLMNSGNNMDGH